jgi:hypothetical protein
MPEDSPWGPDGDVRLPAWMRDYPLMPATWPVELMWMQIGRDCMDHREDQGAG